MSGSEMGNLEARVRVEEKSDPTSQKHIIKAVDYLLRSALRERASDIHIEPKRDHFLVRFRIDGILHDLHRLPMTVHLAMINRLKGVSRLDISEKRRPQDGRVQLVLGGHLRMCAYPPSLWPSEKKWCCVCFPATPRLKIPKNWGCFRPSSPPTRNFCAAPTV